MTCMISCSVDKSMWVNTDQHWKCREEASTGKCSWPAWQRADRERTPPLPGRDTKHHENHWWTFRHLKIFSLSQCYNSQWTFWDARGRGHKESKLTQPQPCDGWKSLLINSFGRRAAILDCSLEFKWRQFPWLNLCWLTPFPTSVFSPRTSVSSISLRDSGTAVR